MNRSFAGVCVAALAMLGCGENVATPPAAPAPDSVLATPSIETASPPTEPVADEPKLSPELAAIEAEVLAEQQRDAQRGFTIRIGAMVGEEDAVSDAFSPTSTRFRVSWTVNEVPKTPIAIHLLTESGRLGFIDRGEIARIEGAKNGAFVWKNAPRTHKLEVRGANQWYMLQVDE